jgi:hypothetical protein
MGFSGILSSLLGSFIFADFCFSGVNPIYAFISLTSFVLLIFIITYSKHLLLCLTVLIICVFFFYQSLRTFSRKVKKRFIRKTKSKILSNFALFIVFSESFILLFLFALLLFPKEIIWKGSYINFFLHYAGILVGMFSGFLLLRAKGVDTLRK